MASSKLDTITHEEFEARLERNNGRLQQELLDVQENVQALELLVARKEGFVQRLTQILTEIEREENEIATLEKGLRPPRTTPRRSRQAPQTTL